MWEYGGKKYVKSYVNILTNTWGGGNIIMYKQTCKRL